MDKSILKIYFLETEYMCRAFATEFKLDPNIVIKEGFKKLSRDYPEIIEASILSDTDINKLNVQELKDALKARNLKMTGNKTELQDRLSCEISKLKDLIKN